MIACIDCYNIVYMENTTESTKITMNQEIVGPSMNINQRRNVWLMLSVLVVVGIVLLAIVIFFISQRLPSEVSTNDTKLTTAIIISPTSSINENQVSPITTVQEDVLANWKTFSNAYFSFRYPPDVLLTEREANEIVLQKWGPTQKVDTEFYDGISISIQPFELPVTAEEYAKVKIEEVERNGIGEISESLKPIQVGAYSGVTFSVVGLGNYRTIILKSPNVMIIKIIDSSNDPGQLGFSRVVDQILTTVVLK